MKTTAQPIKTLFFLSAFLCLLSCCKTTKQTAAAETTTTKIDRQTETVWLHDTTLVDGAITTVVVHDTINGKPAIIYKTTTKTKTVRVGAQTKTATDTVFVHDMATKTVKGSIVPPCKEKAEKHAKNGLIIALIILMAAAAALFGLYYCGWTKKITKWIHPIFDYLSVKIVSLFGPLRERVKKIFGK